jgi:hypothetical protein
MAEDRGLDALIEAEARLANQLAAAEAEARASLAAARLAVEAMESRYAAEMASAAAALAAHTIERRDVEIARIRTAADVEVRRYQAVSGEREEILAAEVVRRVLDTWSTEAEP